MSKKKYRLSYRLFLSEGTKVVMELLQSKFNLHLLCCTENWYKSHSTTLQQVSRFSDAKVVYCSAREIKTISQLTQPQEVLAVFEIPGDRSCKLDSNYYPVFESISDPGNMGAIIRIADWYGFPVIFCSTDSVDPYNPKVVQSSMGSLARVQVISTDIIELFQANKSRSVYAATLKGTFVEEIDFAAEGFLVFGSESHGLSSELLECAHQQMTIRRWGRAESLNVAVATGIICEHLRRS